MRFLRTVASTAVLAIAVTVGLGLLVEDDLAPAEARQASTLIQSGSSLPTTCTAGGSQTSFFIRTGATDPGAYWCSATDTWTGPLGAGGGSGDVTAAANITDHVLTRGDGGAKGIQETGIVVDDADNVSGIVTLSLPVAGLRLFDADATNPLIIAPGSDLSATRTLTVNTGDASRAVTLEVDLDIQDGPQSFTPVWTATTTNPTIGDGTIVGNYYRVGRLVAYQIVITFGASTTPGSGTWLVSVPGTFTAAGHLFAAGRVFDTSTSTAYFLHALQGSATSIFAYIPNGAAGSTSFLAHNHPVTWATGDQIIFGGFALTTP